MKIEIARSGRGYLVSLFARGTRICTVHHTLLTAAQTLRCARESGWPVAFRGI